MKTFLDVNVTIVAAGLAFMLIAAAWDGCRMPWAIGWTLVVTASVAVVIAALWADRERGGEAK